MSLHRAIDHDEGLPGVSAKGVKFHPPTGISCLVVGAGVGGLMAALEFRRKGHDVRVIERSPRPSTAGDYFSIARNIIAHFYNYWPELALECERINNRGLVAYHKLNGERVSGPEPVPIGKPTFTLNDGTEQPIPFHRHHRPKFVAALLAQVKGLGVNVAFGMKVVDYFDNSEEQRAGVILENGERIEADVVVAADGIGTKSNKIVNGGDDRAYSSENDVPHLEIWGGENMSFFVQTYWDNISWLMTHKSNGKGVESWNQTVDVSEVLKITSNIDGFPKVAERLIQTTPKDGIIDWEIMWRDPRGNWTSPGGRLIQVGDSAHTFLPSSGSGASQALEDAISVATCLQIGGKSNIPGAIKIHNTLRFERVSCVQLWGFANYQKQSNPIYGKNSNDDDDDTSFKIILGNWMNAHDAEKYAYAHYGEVLNHLLSGAPFQSQNIPPGYVHKEWTIAELLRKVQNGERLNFDGDWS